MILSEIFLWKKVAREVVAWKQRHEMQKNQYLTDQSKVSISPWKFDPFKQFIPKLYLVFRSFPSTDRNRSKAEQIFKLQDKKYSEILEVI